MRSFIAKLEIAAGLLLAASSLGHAAWCRFSLSGLGTPGPHGLEAGFCHWGTALLRIVVGALAALTLASGLIGYRVRARTGAWYAAQAPAVLAWAWVAYALIYALFAYPY